ncbi:MAG TPA: hypothetical protein VLH75_20085 [Longimicrobiales bacterium]|nr:hypothetical protein [Longimicrobiales bacterium]
MLAAELVEHWKTRARKLREWAAAEEAAKAWEAAAAELEAALVSQAERRLNLQEAAAASGYSPDHLGRLLREGRVPNAGRTHAPRVRVGDLPLKPGRTGGARDGQESPSVPRAQIVQRVVNGVVV